MPLPRAQLQLHHGQRAAAGAGQRGGPAAYAFAGSHAWPAHCIRAHCLAQPVDCRLLLNFPLHLLLPTLQNVHRVSLKKLPYTVVTEEEDAAAAEQQPGAADGPADQQQRQDSDAEGGSGSEGEDDAEEGEDAAEQQRQQGGDPDLQSPGGSGSDDDGSGSEGEQETQDEEDPAAALDAFSAGTAAAVEAFAVAVESDPGAFLQPAPELASLAKSAAKALYDYQAAVDSSAAAAGTAAAAAGPGALPELYIEGFDAEQIWLQMELAAAPALKRARKLLRKVGQEPQLLTPETEEAIDGGCCCPGLGGCWAAGQVLGGVTWGSMLG